MAQYLSFVLDSKTVYRHSKVNNIFDYIVLKTFYEFLCI